MQQFNMNDSVMKLEDIPDSAFGVDENGCLYMKRFRDLFDPLKVDASAVEALAAMTLASRSLHLLQERWAEHHGLSSGRLGVLFRLFRGGDMPLGEMALALDSTPRNVTGLVDHLERDGLVERVPDPDDRRSVRARLTPKGREKIEGIWKEALSRQFELAAGLSKDELVQLRHLCLTLVQSARKELGK